ncbi:hypothetical protein [Croceitalea vernalis]|uniref:Tat pathway signal protein n=1 Tax=Croceitalea vernalis TaxID=3075599 RepID=A0ABU3BFD7_9FLAO|nr:hypothetical protein [Croceitalea sp. P007]MDT0620859.1 hypothetical protein [Croceitalea sp. P007]
MKQGRRNFLKVTSIALAGLTIDPLRAVTTNNNFYVNRALGLAFYKPNNWHYVKVSDLVELKKKLSLADEWKDIEQYVWENTGEPICIIAKYDQNNPQNIGKYSPSIAVWAEPKSDYEEYNFEGLVQYSDTMASARMNYIKDSDLINKKYVSTNGNVSIIEYDLEYTLLHEELSKALRVQTKMVYAEHGSYYYCFDFVDCKEANQVEEDEFNRFREGINLI